MLRDDLINDASRTIEPVELSVLLQLKNQG